MKFTSSIQTNKGYGNLVIVPEDLAEDLLKTYGKRVIIKLNGSEELHRSLQKVHAIGYYFYFGKAQMKALALEPGDSVDVEIKEDNSEYKMAMPESLGEILRTDPKAKEAFEKLSNGKKRSLMHHIGSAKNIDTQINRGLKIAEGLKMGLSELKDFSKL